MTGKGWAVETTEDGGFRTTVGIPVEQNDQYEADLDECRASFGYDQPPTVTRAEAERIYDSFIDIVDCVRSLGFPVADPPSTQAFVEALVARPIPIWHPYDVAQSQSEYQMLKQQCPLPR